MISDFIMEVSVFTVKFVLTQKLIEDTHIYIGNISCEFLLLKIPSFFFLEIFTMTFCFNLFFKLVQLLEILLSNSKVVYQIVNMREHDSGKNSV